MMHNPPLPFLKAESLSNDFVVVFENDIADLDYFVKNIPFIANRKFGIGCDQVIIVDQKTTKPRVRFFNADGSFAEFCGNGVRAIGHLLCQDLQVHYLHMQTHKMNLDVYRNQKGQIAFHLPKPDVLVFEKEALHTLVPDVRYAFFVDVGNPHIVFVMKAGCHLEEYAITYGEKVSKDPCFTNGVNVSFLVIEETESLLVVFERGSGLTLACGSGAIASSCVIHHLIQRTENILVQKGGKVHVNIKQNTVIQSGFARLVFTGLWFYDM